MLTKPSLQTKQLQALLLHLGSKAAQIQQVKQGTFVLVNKPGPWQHNAPQQSSFASPKLVWRHKFSKSEMCGDFHPFISHLDTEILLNTWLWLLGPI